MSCSHQYQAKLAKVTVQSRIMHDREFWLNVTFTLAKFFVLFGVWIQLPGTTHCWKA